MLKVLEDRRDELQRRCDEVWKEIRAVHSQFPKGKQLTERQWQRSGLNLLFVKYHHFERHLDFYSGAWKNGVMLSDDVAKVYDWLCTVNREVHMNAELYDEWAYAKQLVGTAHMMTFPNDEL